MSIVSKQRHEKRPTPASGRPRQFGKLSRRVPLNLTAMQDEMHRANKAAPVTKTRGAFGGCTAAVRKTRDHNSERIKAAA
jgi:hypothetical protein